MKFVNYFSSHFFLFLFLLRCLRCFRSLRCLFVALTLFGFNHFLIVAPPQALAAETREVVVAFPGEIAPWMLENEDAGYMLDLVRGVLKKQNLTVKPRILPLARIQTALEYPEIEIIAWADQRFKDSPLPQSNPIGTVSPELFWLEESNLKLEKPEDLEKVSLIAFQGSSKIWPPLAEIAKKNPHYQELHNQESQMKMFFLKRTQVVLSDKQIFHWWRKKLGDNKEINPNQALAPSIFANKFFFNKDQRPPLRVVFRDTKMRDLFNQGLEELEKSGELEQIRKKYGIEFTY